MFACCKTAGADAEQPKSSLPAEPEKKPAAAPAPESKPPAPAPVAAAPAKTAKMVKKIFIIYYSTYGHMQAMARKVKEGVDSVEGCEGVLYQVAETLPAEVLAKMGAPPKAADVPVISVDDLPKADGFLFGIPTRFGMPSAQMKAFMDATGGLWQTGALVGKPAGVFVSTGCQGGGQEATVMSTLPFFAAHGMPFVPIGYSWGGKQFDVEKLRGGGCWGAGTLAGPTGARMPSEDELEFAKHQGAFTAGFVKRLA